MSTYDNIYRSNQDAWGAKINPLIHQALKFIKPSSKGLDLGCGQGSHSFHLSKVGFEMSLVDISGVAVEQIKEKIAKEDIKNIEVQQADITDYVIKNGEYDFVICLNILQFLDKKNIEKIVAEIKNEINKGGIVVIAAFTDKDPSYKLQGKRLKYYFEENELLNMFQDFECLYYFEGLVDDPGHAGKEQPHKHGIVNIIARK